MGLDDEMDEMFLVSVDADDGSPARRTLSFSRTPTVLLTFAANKFTRQSARAIQETFGLGAMDWRMLVMLTRHPGASVAFSSETIGIDKAAVSRSLRRLEAKSLVAFRAKDSDPRRKDWYLTAEGHHAHDRILDFVMIRLKSQLDGFTQEEVRTFTALLKRFHENLG